MTPYPMDPVDATGPMRIVVTAVPDTPEGERLVKEALARKLAACAQVVASSSSYWWKGAVEHSTERVVWFKTAPKRVGALFRFLAENHPYDVPEIIEVDVARAHPAYLEYLAETLDEHAPPPPLGGGRTGRISRRRAGRPTRAVRRPARIQGPRPHR